MTPSSWWKNVERHIANGLSPMEATKRAMSEVSRPIIAITLVLCAVFIRWPSSTASPGSSTSSSR